MCGSPAPQPYTPTVLITGGRGQVGQELQRLLRRSSVPFDAPGHNRLDVTDAAEVERVLDAAKPDVVIHAAAWTDVDGCEQGRDRALRVNAEATATLARVCAARGTTLVYLSTDFVFDGTQRRPYEPWDPPNPISVYGQSKWEGEEAVRKGGGYHFIVRTSWVYGAFGRNFPKSILRAAAAQRERMANGPLRVVTDQVGSPTYAADLAKVLLRFVGLGGQAPTSPLPSGTYHVANAGQCSWYAFAREIVRQAGWGAPITPITSAELGRPAKRPAYSVLSLKRLGEFGLHMRPWQDALPDFLAELREREPDLFP